MKVLIYIELLEEPSLNYEKEIISRAKENIKDLVSFDLDNFSDPYMFKYAIELIEKEEKIILLIDVKSKTETRKLIEMIEKIIKHKDKCMVLINGDNTILEKMFGILGERFKKEKQQNNQIKIISDFLNA